MHPPDIFISYAREDVDWVRPLAAELERRGWRVFWDQRIPAGKSWRSHIGVRLESARCVIVVWSEFALKSRFVLQEADIGLEREVLMPVLRQPVRPPLGFREVHAASLAEWRPGQPSAEFETFIADLGELLMPSLAVDSLPVVPEAKPPAETSSPSPLPRPAAHPRPLATIIKERPAGEPEPVGRRGRTGPALVLSLVALAATGAGLYAMYRPTSTLVQQAATPPPQPSQPELEQQTAAPPPAESAPQTNSLKARPKSSEPIITPPTAAPPPMESAPPTSAPVVSPEPSQTALTPPTSVPPASELAPPTSKPPPLPPAAAVASVELSPPAPHSDEPTIGSPTPADLEAKLGLSRDDWRKLQRAITALGFDTGGADGKPGPMTRGAVAAWQASKQLEATRYLGPLQRELIVAEAQPKLAALDAAASEQSAATISDTLPASVRPGPLSHKPDTVFRDCPDCPEMVVIPAGSFTMGSPSTEADRKTDEGPQRKVTMTQPFALGRYEVTFAQWDACVAAAACNGYRPGDQGWGRGSQPVITVSWQDAQGFVTWLSGKTGQPYRLPTEAEWEYAARAGTTTPFWTGSTISTAQANYDGNYTYGAGAIGIYRARTVAVNDSTFSANPFGLFHMHGNVWEWVQDCYHGDYDGAPIDGSKAIEDSACSWRVLRGGSWYEVPRFLRSAYRIRDPSDSRFKDIGFRVARMLTP